MAVELDPTGPTDPTVHSSGFRRPRLAKSTLQQHAAKIAGQPFSLGQTKARSVHARSAVGSPPFLFLPRVGPRSEKTWQLETGACGPRNVDSLGIELVGVLSSRTGPVFFDDTVHEASTPTIPHRYSWPKPTVEKDEYFQVGAVETGRFRPERLGAYGSEKLGPCGFSVGPLDPVTTAGCPKSGRTLVVHQIVLIL